MYNRIWIWAITSKAKLKESLGLELTDFEDFLIEIGLD